MAGDSGGAFKYKVITRPELIFRTVDNDYYTLPQSGFKVIPAEHEDPNTRKRMLELTPSILGMDVLSKFEVHITKKKVELIPQEQHTH